MKVIVFLAGLVAVCAAALADALQALLDEEHGCPYGDAWSAKSQRRPRLNAAAGVEKWL
jgi:hypothetical protein